MPSLTTTEVMEVGGGTFLACMDFFPRALPLQVSFLGVGGESSPLHYFSGGGGWIFYCPNLNLH